MAALALPLGDRYRTVRYQITNPELSGSLEVIGSADLRADTFEAADPTGASRWYGEGPVVWSIWPGMDRWSRGGRYPEGYPITFPPSGFGGWPAEGEQRAPRRDPTEVEARVDASITRIEVHPSTTIRGRRCSHATVTIDRTAGLPEDLATEVRETSGPSGPMLDIDLHLDPDGRPCRYASTIWDPALQTDMSMTIDLWGYDEPVAIVRPPDLPSA